MTKDEVLKLVLESPSLPTLPTVACKLISISSKEETGMRDIANLISKDSSLSFLTVKSRGKKGVFDYEKFWERCLANAAAAKLIMAEIDQSEWEEIFIAGPLQDIGELILALSLPEQYELVLSEEARSGKNIIELEQQIIGADHTFIGYEVTKTWRFPAVLLTPIRYHHCPEGYQGKDKKLALAVNVVYLSGIITSILYSKEPQKYHQKFLDESKAILGFDANTTDRILERVVSEITQTASLFGFHLANTKSIEEILQEANVALGVINLTYDQMNRELIENKVQLQQIAKELEEKNKRLEMLVHLDSLTEVNNHGYFQNFLEKEINLAKRRNTPLSLILADVDYFKSFNDRYGHQIGDFILKELCKLMKRSLRNYDIIARYGGEEFAIVLVETAGQEAQTVAEKLRESIAAHTFINGNKKYSVTVSFGVAEIKPAIDVYTKNDLIKFADEALFESKRKGRNNVTMYAEDKN